MRTVGILIIAVLLSSMTASCSPPGRTDADQAQSHFILGLSYLKERSPSLALKEFFLAEGYDGGDPHIQGGIGQAYHSKGAFAEAEKHYLRAIELSAGSPSYQNNLAVLYLDLQRWDDAIRYFRKATDNHLFAMPTGALMGAGYAHFQKGEFLEAVSAYKEALEIDRASVRGHLQLGQAYYALDKAELAAQEYRRSIDLAPGNAEGHFRLGLAHTKLGDTEAARTSFAKAAALAPDSRWSEEARGYLEVLR